MAQGLRTAGKRSGDMSRHRADRARRRRTAAWFDIAGWGVTDGPGREQRGAAMGAQRKHMHHITE
jgi:hypothetical protein